jgi:phosphoglycerate dehydrogenase-like enzyme
MTTTTAPRVAVEPRRVDWAVEAVRLGGGALASPPEAEALIWLDPADTKGLVSTLAAAPGVRWVQLPYAGIERFAATGGLKDGRRWTCAKRIYGQSVAEHALGLALAGLRDIVPSARARTWGPQSGRVLGGGRVTIVGAGGITDALLELLAPLRVTTTVVRNRPEPLAGAYRTVGRDFLHEALGDADVVVLALALTPQSRGIIAAPELKAMPEHAWLVNVARGGHVITDDLVVALREGWIGGAALDVTDPEPLPDDHPLWGMANCLITPHIANTARMSQAPLSALIADNVARFAAGQPLVGLVDPELGY